MQSSFTIHTASVLYLESCCDGIWRSHFRESICITSITSEDFLRRKLDERIGFRCRWNQPSHPIIQQKPKTYQERGDPSVDKSPPRSRSSTFIDFRVPGLSHAVVKEAEHVRVVEIRVYVYEQTILTPGS